MIAYMSQDDLGEPITVKLSHKEAIGAQKEAGETQGYTYTSDKEALDDFISIHWAWEIMIFEIGKTTYIDMITIVKERNTGEILKLTKTEDESILTDQYGRSWKLTGIWTLELVTN